MKAKWKLPPLRGEILRVLGAILGAAKEDALLNEMADALLNLNRERKEAKERARHLREVPDPDAKFNLAGAMAFIARDFKEGSDAARRAYHRDPNAPVLTVGYGVDMTGVGRERECRPRRRKFSRNGSSPNHAPGLTVAQVIMDHFAENAAFLLSDAMEWCVHCGYRADSAGPALRWLKRQGYVRKIKPEGQTCHFVFVRPVAPEDRPVRRSVLGEG